MNRRRVGGVFFEPRMWFDSRETLLLMHRLAFFVSLLMSCAVYECVDGDCICPSGGVCDFECDAPPCRTLCEGNNPSCVGVCANGDCECGEGSRCDFECGSPPCHVACSDSSECVGTCANGDCECGLGSRCEFECESGPCHARCLGDNPLCRAECSNGSCECGPGSTCDFRCLSGPCHVRCAAGASCVVLCPNGRAGTQDCDIVECGEQVQICADGDAVTCGALCPDLER